MVTLQLQESSCFDSLTFLALDTCTGLDDYIDGILGLSPNKGPEYDDEHILPMMQASGMIDNASVSFSIATLQMNEDSYAIFGDWNPEQVVGGAQGLFTFPNFENVLQTWALPGQGLYYGGEQVLLETEELPAIIDTGSTLVSLPPQVFEELVQQWQSDV